MSKKRTDASKVSKSSTSRTRTERDILHRLDSLMEKLEDRVLFDGVPDAPVLDNVPAVDLPIEAAADQVSQVQDVSQLEIVFLDPAVENGDQLLVELLMSASERSMEVHLLDAGEDGLEQICLLYTSPSPRD